MEYLTGLVLGFLGGKYGGSWDIIVVLSVSMCYCSTSSSLSLMGSASSCGSIGSLSFLSCFFFVLYSKVDFFLGDLHCKRGDAVGVIYGTVASINPSIPLSSNM